MTVLCFKRIVAGGPVIAEQIELAREVRPGRDVNVLPHQFACSGANVRERQDVGIREAVLDRGIPFIRCRQYMVWIDYSQDRRWGIRCESWRLGYIGIQRERSI